jgi:hypothetical protein
MIEDVPREPARKKAERKWANHDLRRRYKEAKEKDAPELDTPKPVVTTVVNPYFEEQKHLHELMQKSRRAFIRQMHSLTKDHKERAKKEYLAYLYDRRRRCLAEKLRRLLVAQKENEHGAQQV